MTQRYGNTPLETQVEKWDDLAVNLQLSAGDRVSLAVDVRGPGTTTLGLYHAGGALHEEVLSGGRTLELEVGGEADDTHLLFLSTRDTAVDVELTVLQ